MDKNNIINNLDSIQVPTPIPIPTPFLIENQLNKESLLQQLLSNKLYIYIIIGIIILAISSYYLYNKYFSKKGKGKEDEEGNEEEADEDEEKRKEKKEEILKEPETKKHIISSGIEYYLLDHNEKPILINKYFNNLLNNSYEQSILINNKLNKQQRPKLIHPNKKNISNISEDDDNEDNDDNDNDDNEDNNITTQDLTREEIEELKKQLEIMQRKQNSSITAENDEDNNEGTF